LEKLRKSDTKYQMMTSRRSSPSLWLIRVLLRAGKKYIPIHLLYASEGEGDSDI